MTEIRGSASSERKRWQLDTAALLAAVPLTAAAARIWLFSRGDTVVFRTLLRTLDTPALLIGTATQLVPIGLLWVTIFLMTDWRFRDAFKAWAEKRNWLRFVVLPTLFVLLVTLPLITVGVAVLGIAVPAILFVQLRKRWRWGREHIFDVLVAPRGDANGPNTGISATVLLVVTLMSATTMWLPLERVHVGDRGEVIVAYVLATDEVWTTLLTDERDVATVRTEDVREREVCTEAGGARLADYLVTARANHDRDVVDCGRDP